MSENVQQFYDELANSYTFIFKDWQAGVKAQGTILNTFLREMGAESPATLLDCTCGVGTQAIGLALHGYQVTGADLSPKAIENARENATLFDTPHPMTFYAADLLQPPANPQQYDIVVALDNAVAHFHTSEELDTAIQTMLLQLKEDGLLVISLRDYDALVADAPQVSPARVYDDEQGRRVVLQTWDWAEDLSSYQMQMFIIQQDGADWQTEVHSSHLRALRKADIMSAFEHAGIRNIQWHTPEASGYYQPIITGRKHA